MTTTDVMNMQKQSRNCEGTCSGVSIQCQNQAEVHPVDCVKAKSPIARNTRPTRYESSLSSSVATPTNAIAMTSGATAAIVMNTQPSGRAAAPISCK